ncbi:hypothetical protein ACTQ8I_004205 [Vibrio vulnificus]|nr:hypothetical protein [Vibrio vulnificus]
MYNKKLLALVFGLVISGCGDSSEPDTSLTVNEYMGFKLGGDSYKKTLSFIEDERDDTNNPFLLGYYGTRINNPVPVRDIELNNYSKIYTPEKFQTKTTLTFSNLDNDKLYKLQTQWHGFEVESLYQELAESVSEKYQGCESVVIDKSYAVYGTECKDGDVDILLSIVSGTYVSIEYVNRVMANKIDTYMVKLTAENDKAKEESKAKI